MTVHSVAPLCMLMSSSLPLKTCKPCSTLNPCMLQSKSAITLDCTGRIFGCFYPITLQLYISTSFPKMVYGTEICCCLSNTALEILVKTHSEIPKEGIAWHATWLLHHCQPHCPQGYLSNVSLLPLALSRQVLQCRHQ